MRDESDIRLMMQHLRSLVAKYQSIKEEAAARRDTAAERVAFMKETMYFSTYQGLAWALGDIEAQLPSEDMPGVSRPSTA